MQHVALMQRSEGSTLRVFDLSWLTQGILLLTISITTAWMLSQMLAVLLVPLTALQRLAAAQDAAVRPSDGSSTEAVAAKVDLSWHAPDTYYVNNLSSALNSQGTYGFVFNSSTTPPGVPYATYNWCNMPHVRASEYVKPPASFALKYVEVIHRHHKRTPYASNCFPVETQPWSCGGAKLFFFAGQPLNYTYSQTFWNIQNSAPNNPFRSAGFPGDCAFPQETAEALRDSMQHGADLYQVYGDMLGLIRGSVPGEGVVQFRATNNIITSQVGGALIHGMFNGVGKSALAVQSSDIDSLEPAYSCPKADDLFASYGVGSSSPNWTAHLQQARALFARLDVVSGVDPSDQAWHQSLDHYFDNLSARLCHSHPLPCQTDDAHSCVSQQDANQVFRLGEYEYSYIYRDGGPDSLAASVASFGVWIAELSAHLRSVREGSNGPLRYTHNIAHDGSLSRLLSILQIDRMVWPGMGAEVVFELYQANDEDWRVRVLWGGQVLHSSNPSLGLMNMLPLDTLLAYLDGLAGLQASQIPARCGRSSFIV